MLKVSLPWPRCAPKETVFAFVNSTIIEDRMAAECCHDHDPTFPTRTFPEQQENVSRIILLEQVFYR